MNRPSRGPELRRGREPPGAPGAGGVRRAGQRRPWASSRCPKPLHVKEYDVAARERASPAVLSAALSGLGRSLHDGGRPLEAVDPLHEAAALAAEQDDASAEVWALALLGSALTMAGRRTEAAAAFRRSRAAVRRVQEPVSRAAVHPARPDRPAAPPVTVVEATVPPGAVPPGAAARGSRSGGGAASEKGSHFRRASTAYAQVTVVLAVAAWAAFAPGGPWATAAAVVTGVSAVLALVAGLAFRNAGGADVATPAQVALRAVWTLLTVPVPLLHVISLMRGELFLTGPVPSLAGFVAYLGLAALVRRVGRFGAVALGV